LLDVSLAAKYRSIIGIKGRKKIMVTVDGVLWWSPIDVLNS